MSGIEAAYAYVSTVGAAGLGDLLLLGVVWRMDNCQRNRYLEAVPTTTHLDILCVV